MLENKSKSSIAFPCASEATSLAQRGGSGSNGRRPMQRDIGFIGLGHMGNGMAVNILKRGFPLQAMAHRNRKG